MKKREYPSGDGHWRTKLTEEDRRIIRKLYETDEDVSAADLANHYKVSERTIYRVLKQEDSLSGAGETLDNGISIIPQDEVQRILNGC